jgi:hypothetical protein
MSTIRTLLLVITTASTLAIATATAHNQTGIGPQILSGPSLISTSMALGRAKTTPYTYTVTLNQNCLTDTVCSISDAGGHISAPATVKVPAGSKTATFPASGVTDGQDTLTVYNTFSSASCNVTITSG